MTTAPKIIIRNHSDTRCGIDYYIVSHKEPSLKSGRSTKWFGYTRDGKRTFADAYAAAYQYANNLLTTGHELV